MRSRDLPRAHRAQPQGPRAGRGRRREPYEGRAREAAYRAVNPMVVLSRFDRRRRTDPVRVVGDHRISQRAASEPAAAAARRPGLRGCEGVCTNPRKEIAFTECGGGRNRIVALKTSTN